MRQHAGPGHHPECVAVSMDEIAEELGGWSADRPSAKDIFVLRCHDDCERLAEALEVGRKKAAEMGW